MAIREGLSCDRKRKALCMKTSTGCRDVAPLLDDVSFFRSTCVRMIHEGIHSRDGDRPCQEPDEILATSLQSLIREHYPRDTLTCPTIQLHDIDPSIRAQSSDAGRKYICSHRPGDFSAAGPTNVHVCKLPARRARRRCPPHPQTPRNHTKGCSDASPLLPCSSSD